MYSVIGYMLNVNSEIQGYGLVRHGCSSVVFVTTDQARYLVQRNMIDNSLWAWIIEQGELDKTRKCVVYQQDETGTYVLLTMYAYILSCMSEDERFLKLIDEVQNTLHITVDESLPREELLLQLSESEDEKIRSVVAKYGFNLGIFLYDSSEAVKEWVVKQGYGLDTLIEDDSEKIRCGVAECAFGVTDLMEDDSEEVRLTLARMGLCLDYFLKQDDTVAVKIAIAKLGYGFEQLITDSEPMVRAEIASNGFGVEYLLNDENGMVRAAAKKYRKSGKPEIVYEPVEAVQTI